MKLLSTDQIGRYGISVGDKRSSLRRHRTRFEKRLAVEHRICPEPTGGSWAGDDDEYSLAVNLHRFRIGPEHHDLAAVPRGERLRDGFDSDVRRRVTGTRRIEVGVEGAASFATAFEIGTLDDRAAVAVVATRTDRQSREDNSDAGRTNPR